MRCARIPTATPPARTASSSSGPSSSTAWRSTAASSSAGANTRSSTPPKPSSGRRTISRPTAATSTSAGSAAVFLKEIGVEAGWDKQGVYNEAYTAVVPGSETTVQGHLVLRPRSNLEWSVEGGWIRQTVDSTGAEAFNGLAYETALHYQLTRSLFLNTRFFGETRENQYSLDVLLGYYFGAGNIVQLALKKSERNELLGRIGGYSITLKVSYLLRI